MTNDCFVYTSNERGYIIGDKGPRFPNGDVKYYNGIKSEYVDVIESIVVPRTYNNINIYRLEYRCFCFLPKLKNAFIPNTITELGGDTFLGCKCLESVIFEENMKLKSFNIFAFRLSNITFIDIPNSVTELCRYTFADMQNLRVIYIHSYIESISSELFVNTNTSNIKIYVPRDYPNKTILGVPILKVLNPRKKQRTKCFWRKQNTMCIFIICALICN